MFRLAAESFLLRTLPERALTPNVCSVRRSSITNPQGLPSLPVPKLQDTLKKYLETVQPHLSAQSFAKTQDVVKKFGVAGGVGEKLQRLLEERATKKENWLSDWWLENAYLKYRDPVVVFSSPGLVFPKRKFQSEQDRLAFTAKVVSAALHYKSLIDAKKIAIEYVGKMPLDMQQYDKIFGTCRIPGLEKDSLSYNPNSQHIVLVLDNDYYEIPIYGKGRKVLSEKQILDSIQHCINDVKIRKQKAAPIGVLSTDNRDNWGRAYTKLIADPQNRASVERIQSALFVLCLDRLLPSVEPADENDTVTACHQLIHGGGSHLNSGNRWYDKTLQLIVGENGINGLTYEHSPAEGGPIAVLTDYIINYIESCRHENSEDISNAPQPKRLEFNVTPDIEESIKTASTNIDRLIADLDMNYLHFTNYGKNFIKNQKMSPDSFVQMAIQYAFYRLHKVPGAHYESAQTRLYIHGRTETIRSCSNESTEFAKSMTENAKDEEKVAKLKKAVNAHKKYVANAIQGFGVDRHLLGLKLIANENNIPLPELYADEGYTKSTHMRLSTSNVSSRFDAFMCYGPLTNDGYGCCYSLKNDDIWFGISSFRSCSDTSSLSFKKCLEECLNHMYELLSRAGEPPKSKL